MIVDSVEGLRAELPERHPLIPIGEFNLACLRALQGRPKEALEALGRAVDTGYARPDALKESDELRSLHGKPEFQAIVAAAAENARNAE